MIGLAGGSDAPDAPDLLLRAFARQEADLLVPSRAGDEDVFVRVNHAIVAGLDPNPNPQFQPQPTHAIVDRVDPSPGLGQDPEGAASAGVRALRAAYEMDRVATGVSAQGFLARWIPAEFEQMLPDARRALQSHAP